MDRERVLIDTSSDRISQGRQGSHHLFSCSRRSDYLVSAITEFEFRDGSTAANRDFVSELLDLTPVLPFDSTCVRVRRGYMAIFEPSID